MDKKDSFIFWAMLYGTPAIWVLLGVVAILKVRGQLGQG